MHQGTGGTWYWAWGSSSHMGWWSLPVEHFRRRTYRIRSAYRPANGIARVYAQVLGARPLRTCLFRDSKKYPKPPALAKKLSAAADLTLVIVEAALTEPAENPICVAVLELFISILGAEAGNFAFKVSCYGGMYIGGGIPPRMADYL